MAGFHTTQGTLAAKATFSGRGLHSGKRVTITVHPAAPGHGIVFAKDGGHSGVSASWHHTITLPRCTTLRAADGTRYQTIEHLMASLFAMQIDNALIEIRGGHEIPILDGSAKRIFDLLAQVGRVDQGEPRRFFRVLKKVEFRKGPVSITISPSDDFAVSFTLELPHYGQQRWDGIVTPNGFASEITFARTYGLLKQILVPLILGKMRLVPLLRGASLNNAVVIAGRGVLNRHGLRCPDEFVRHRVLDLVGDMMLAGAPLIGKVEAVCTGHIHNRTLLTQLFNTPDAWREEFLE